jgi:hypothetical protein
MPEDNIPSEINPQLELLNYEESEESTSPKPRSQYTLESISPAKYAALLSLITKLTTNVNFLMQEHTKEQILKTSDTKRSDIIRTAIISIVVSLVGALVQFLLKSIKL